MNYFSGTLVLVGLFLSGQSFADDLSIQERRQHYEYNCVPGSQAGKTIEAGLGDQLRQFVLHTFDDPAGVISPMVQQIIADEKAGVFISESRYRLGIGCSEILVIKDLVLENGCQWPSKVEVKNANRAIEMCKSIYLPESEAKP